MATLTATDIQDLVVGTLYDLGRLKFQQIAQDLQDYEVFSHWFRSDKVAFDSGIGIQRTLMTKVTNVAKHVGLMEEDEVDIPNLLEQMQVNWRHCNTSWAFIYQEALMNRGRAMVLNIIEPRRANALLSLVGELEDRGWTCPTSSSDKKYPMGLTYWVVQNATEGFNGGAPSGHTTVAGIDVSEVTTFKNWTNTYTTVNKADLIKKMRTAHRKVRFKSPINLKDYREGRGDRYRIYMNEETISNFEDEAEKQNDNLGRDVAQLDNSTVFRNHPVIWIPKLDEETNNPIYMIDHSSFYPVCLKGDYLRESQASRAPKQHNVFQFFVDLTYNYICVDRRRQAVFYQA
jgi:hypothetical protein